MSKTRKLITVGLVIAAISTVVSVISAIINPEAVSIFAAGFPAIVTVVLCIALLSEKKDEGK